MPISFSRMQRAAHATRQTPRSAWGLAAFEPGPARTRTPGCDFVPARDLRSNDYGMRMINACTPPHPIQFSSYQAFFDLANVVCRCRAQRLPEVRFVWSREHRHPRRRDTVCIVGHDGAIPFRSRFTEWSAVSGWFGRGGGW